jgi:uncharacterized protein YjdB
MRHEPIHQRPKICAEPLDQWLGGLGGIGARDGTNSSLVIGMRKLVGWVVGLAVVGTLACDDRAVNEVAGVGNPGSGSNTGLTVQPNDVQITVGSTTQLTTNTGSSTQLLWLSSDNNVASVSATGLVTGRGVGTATITVIFTSDTTNRARANISVTP